MNGSPSERRLNKGKALNIRHGIILLAIAGGGLLTTLVSYDIWRDRAAAIEVASVRTQNLVLVLEEHTRQTLRRVDLSLETAADAVRRVSNPANTDRRTLAEQLRAALSDDGLIRAISLIDRDGQVYASTRPGAVAPTNAADRDFFIVHRERHDAGVFIGATVKSRVDGQWTLPVSRRLSNPDGSLAGVIVAIVEPAYFQRFYESIDTGTDGFVTMFLRSGWIVVRKPFNEAVLARPWHESPMFRVHVPNSDTGMVRQIVAATGIESLYSYRALKDYPVIVTVGRSLGDSLAAWRARAWRESILLVLAIALLFTGTRAMVRQLARNDAAQAGLRESQERFRQLAENIHEVFWMTDPAKNTMLYISPGYERIWGRTCESLYANPDGWIEAVHADDRAELKAAVAKQPAGTYDEQYRVVRPDGANRWIRDRAFPVRNPGGEVFRIVGVAEDITEERRLHDVLRTEREQQHRLIEMMAEGVVLIDRNGFYRLANAAAERIIGVPRAGIVGVRYDQVEWSRRNADAAPLPLSAHPFEQCRGGVARIEGAELAIVRPDGTIVEVALNCVRLNDPSGEFDGIITTFADISDRKRTEQAHRTLEAQLRQAQKMEAIGTLAGGVAHDLNNMLAAILGNAELARHESEAVYAVSQNLNEIVTASLRAKGLVEQILAFSRQRPLERRVIDPRLVVQETAMLLRATIPSSIEVVTRIVEPVPNMLADATQLQQALLNLGTNAWQAMETGGRIDIDIAAAVIDERLVAAHPELIRGPGVKITVRDTGNGMDAATLERIFDPFFTTKAPGKGTGLGLSVAHGVVRSHFGAISVESRLGAGSTFRIYLPAVASEAAVPMPHPGAGVPVRGNGERILYVDDERALVLFATRALERLGYKVRAFTSPTEAVSTFLGDPDSFDIVVTDFNMPDLTGVEVALEVKNLRPAMPVMITSGYIDDRLREEAARAGVVHLLAKPATVNELGEAVSRLLRKHPTAGTRPPKHDTVNT